jgi:hypothetical protein
MAIKGKWFLKSQPLAGTFSTPDGPGAIQSGGQIFEWSAAVCAAVAP